MFERPSQLPDGLAGDAYSAAGKAGPPLAIVGSSAAGLTLEDWVMIVTIIYVVLQILYLGFKFIRDLRRGGKEHADG